MHEESIAIGFHTFLADDAEELGPISAISDNGEELTVHVENAGEIVLPVDAVASVRSDKVILDCSKLEPEVHAAIGHDHGVEDLPTG